jgi:hypothetical protein
MQDIRDTFQKPVHYTIGNSSAGHRARAVHEGDVKFIGMKRFNL